MTRRSATPATTSAAGTVLPAPRGIVDLLRDGGLDAQFGAVLWLLLDARLPLVVALDSPQPAAGGLGALLDDAGGRALEADSLSEVFDVLRRPPHSLTDDALRSIGVVLVARRRPGGAYRIAAAHYVRPPERDAAGHVQRRPPAVLATWDAEAGRFEHFAWGIAPELADRTGRQPAEFDSQLRERSDALVRLAARWPAR